MLPSEAIKMPNRNEQYDGFEEYGMSNYLSKAK